MHLIQDMYINFPFIGAFLLGIIGALEPCQFSNNLATFMLNQKDITTKKYQNLNSQLLLLAK